jgi:hypothetical protein
MTHIPRYQNQGQRVAAGWDNAAQLKDWTAYLGVDGERFAPPNDRNGYTGGVTRRMNTGGTLQSGFPVVRLTFPWMSDGQIDYLHGTLNGGSESGLVTVAVHTPLSVGKYDVSTYNAVMNLNFEQITSLTRRRNGYTDFVFELVLVEVL